MEEARRNAALSASRLRRENLVTPICPLTLFAIATRFAATRSVDELPAEIPLLLTHVPQELLSTLYADEPFVHKTIQRIGDCGHSLVSSAHHPGGNVLSPIYNIKTHGRAQEAAGKGLATLMYGLVKISQPFDPAGQKQNDSLGIERLSCIAEIG